MIRSILLLAILSTISIFAHEESALDASTTSDVSTQILAERPDSIESIQEDRLYLKTERIFPTNQGLFLFNNHSSIPLSAIFSDHNGCYVTRKKQKSNDFMCYYRCTNKDCSRVWDANQGSSCPVCKSPGEIIY